MGTLEQQKFSQYPYQYGDGLRGAALAQTRNGKDELITPVALWELDDASGLYLPPGLSTNPRRPRVEATVSGEVGVSGEVDVSDQADRQLGRVTLSGHAMELFGPTAAQRPAANSVPVGAVYMAVNTGEIWQSNGTDWVMLT